MSDFAVASHKRGSSIPSGTVQAKASGLSGALNASPTAQRQEALSGALNHQTIQRMGGLPADLQAGMESLSGMSLDHVQVHYNSSAPAQLGAYAHTQGSDIHVAPGQERHLAHEAWHVVQQAQGRVKPTIDVGGTPVNNDPSLESEADRMGAQASQMAKI